MLETPHVIVAAAIAYKIGNPALALPLALGSHFVLEKVPHWNPHLNTEIKKFGKLTTKTMQIIKIDATISAIVGIFIASRVLPDIGHAATILVSCCLGVIPDVIEAPYFLWRKKNTFFIKLVAFQKSIQNDTSYVFGLLSQLAVIFAAFFWIVK